jgi:hypothetical protein
MKIALLWIVAALVSLPTHAVVSIESGCYRQTPQLVGTNNSFLFFQSYRDEDLLEEVGAFVSYNNSEKRIALLFSDEVQGEGANEGDYQKIWLEVVGRKVTGQYVEHGNYSGNSAGKHMKYTNFKTRRVTTFGIATINNPCSSGGR